MENDQGNQISSEGLVRAQQRVEEANSALYKAQLEALNGYLTTHYANLDKSIQKRFDSLPDANARKIFLGKLETAIAKGTPLETAHNPDSRTIDLDAASSLNEVVCRAISYMDKQYSDNQLLAGWMNRSLPTVYRLKELAKRVLSGKSSLDEFSKIDLRGKGE